MSKESGFLQLRRGIWEHVRDGSLMLMGVLVYIYMLTQADTRTGIWKGSAQCLATALNIPKSTAKYALKSLDGKYIRRFAIPGKHVCYPILLHKFLVTQGQHAGLMLDALSSTSERSLQFFDPDDSKQVVEQVGPQRIIENKEGKKDNPAPSAPSDPRHKPAFHSCYQAYRTRFGLAPTWAGREAKALQRFLQEHPGITAEEIARRFLHLLASTDCYHAEKHGSLVHLLSNFDVFADGPLHNNLSSKEGGRNRAEERERNNLRAAGFI